MKIELSGFPTTETDSKDFKRRQQDIDALLVLAKLLEAQTMVTEELRIRVQAKASTLIDRI